MFGFRCLHNPYRCREMRLHQGKAHGRFVVRHGEVSHEVDAALHVYGDGAARTGPVVKPFIEVSGESGVFLESQASLLGDE